MHLKVLSLYFIPGLHVCSPQFVFYTSSPQSASYTNQSTDQWRLLWSFVWSKRCNLVPSDRRFWDPNQKGSRPLGHRFT